MARHSKISRKYSKSGKKRSIRKSTKKRKIQRGGVGWGDRCAKNSTTTYMCDSGLICKESLALYASNYSFGRIFGLKTPRPDEVTTCQRP